MEARSFNAFDCTTLAKIVLFCIPNMDMEQSPQCGSTEEDTAFPIDIELPSWPPLAYV